MRIRKVPGNKKCVAKPKKCIVLHFLTKKSKGDRWRLFYADLPAATLHTGDQESFWYW